MSKRKMSDWLREAFFLKDKASLAQLVKDAEEEEAKKAEENGNGENGTGHKEPDGDEGDNNETHSGHRGGIHIHVEHSGDAKVKDADEEKEERLAACEDGIRNLRASMAKVLDHLGVKDEGEVPPEFKEHQKKEGEEGEETSDEGGSAEPTEGETGALTAGDPGSAEPELMEADPALKTGRSMMGDSVYKVRANQALASLIAETRARAEVLAPGIKPAGTLDGVAISKAGTAICDLRRSALGQALNNAETRKAIGPYLTASTLKGMSCDAVRFAFYDASDKIRAFNNQRGRPTPAFAPETPRTFYDEQRRKVAAWNDQNKDYWTKNGGLGVQQRPN